MVKTFKVVGIGNAMVDVLMQVDEAFLIENKIQKNFMQLIGLNLAKEYYSKVPSKIEMSGGSAANTISGLSSLNIPTAYIGKVKDDYFGNIFKYDMIKQGIIYSTELADKNEDLETGRCIVCITPDGERSMNTYLGITEFLDESDIDLNLIRNTDWVYLEGYRFDGEKSKRAFSKTVNEVRKSKGKVALTLSDPFCVERHLKAFKDIIRDSVDLLFCNEHELKLLCGEQKINDAIRKVSQDVTTVACTLGEKGAIISHLGNIVRVPTKSQKPVDTTGAGDLFASGFLYGLLSGKSIYDCGKLGNKSAEAIINQFGPRYSGNLFRRLNSK